MTANKRPFYIVFEGLEGVGKTTQVQKLVDYLQSKGKRVLQTKEPGTSYLPLTMELRKLMLDSQYDSQQTVLSRELISQAIRSIHMEKLVYPALKSGEYDFIIQDRGILSGFAYGIACGNKFSLIESITNTMIADDYGYEYLYDLVIYLTGNVSEGLERASHKKEFEEGDAMEKKGATFLETVGEKMECCSQYFSTRYIDINGKNIEQVFAEIKKMIEVCFM
ncbi:MAG TPA: dTMP kinase [Nitrosarchaeum sp.]|nr:dTMP kinase [Nitrosarchaeum sp.]